jgi:hypothetical protein
MRNNQREGTGFARCVDSDGALVFTCVCMYVCMHVCMYAYMYAYMYVMCGVWLDGQSGGDTVKLRELRFAHFAHSNWYVFLRVLFAEGEHNQSSGSRHIPLRSDGSPRFFSLRRHQRLLVL